MTNVYNSKFRVKFLRSNTINNTPVDPGNFIIDIDTGKILVDLLSADNTVRRVSLAGGMIYCGSVPTYDDLPRYPTNGDMYNVLENDANYVWSDAEHRWDSIGGVIDLSGYYTKVECDDKFVTEANLQQLIHQLDAAASS